MIEEWRPVPQWEGIYEVSNLGNVRSVDRVVSNGSRRKGRLLRPAPNRDGYGRVHLRGRPDLPKNHSVHALVAAAFIGPRPKGHEVCHNDGNPGNNRLDNLRYDTASANQRDKVKHGRCHLALRTHCPYGHELTDWNNVAAKSTIGRRNCKACGNARSYARYYGRDFDPKVADQYFLRSQETALREAA